MHGRPRYAPLYEENPVGPPITLEDFHKTAVSLETVLRVIRIPPELSVKDGLKAIKDIGKAMTAQLGRQWSVFTAMQYLTGQKADKAVIRWATQFEDAGLSQRQIRALIDVANDFCANAVPGKTLSGGLLVEAYRDNPAGPRAVMEAWDLPESVIAAAVGALDRPQ